ncbi:unnamed protein product [Schistosoma mattheei]|uniref:Uncharacterized protein n=1 Tax=Schistosoma mattheei TaxID=31246 RepID=A0AA85C056_9TREM|nr:unnamed protein product [Schistosoma mattheei]
MHECLRAKCHILGSPYCGKTSIVQSFCSGGLDFPKNYLMSKTVEFVVKTMTIPGVDENIELFLYNIPGKEVFQDPMNHYINMTNLIVVVFDVTNQESFSSAKLTLTELRKPNNIRIPVVLVGSKIDLKEKYINNVEEAQGFADDLGIPYFEASAKEAVGIDVPFLHLIKEYYELYNDAVNDYQTLV